MDKTLELYYQQGNVVVSRATRGDAEYIAYNMRKSDRDEIWASNHLSPAEAMKFTIEKTIFCLTVHVDGKPTVMFGCNGESVLGDRGTIWMLATDDIKKIRYRFVRHSRHFVDMMLDFYPYLCNYVSADNTVSLGWLKMLGARIEKPRPYGVEGKMFCFFDFHKEK